MIPTLIHTHLSRLCVYSRASRAPPLHHSYHSAWCGPPNCCFIQKLGWDLLLCSLHKLLHDLAKSFTKTQNIKNRGGAERKERERGQSEESYKNCQVCTPVCSHSVWVSVCCFKRKGIAPPAGAPETRVRALLGWRPGTDLRVCLKCRLQILCTKSLQEYPWPLESLSGFLSGPAMAARPSLKSSGLARDMDIGRTRKGTKMCKCTPCACCSQK